MRPPKKPQALPPPRPEGTKKGLPNGLAETIDTHLGNVVSIVGQAVQATRTTRLDARRKCWTSNYKEESNHGRGESSQPGFARVNRVGDSTYRLRFPGD